MQKRGKNREGEGGYLLVGVIFMVALVLIALSVAAPRVALELRREREVESQHRANEYVRAIQLYYRKFKRYPTSVEQLENSNNIRFLRKRYADPLTGKADYRLILVGQNKTTVKGFFGEPLAGIPTSGAGGIGGGGTVAPAGPTGSTGTTGSTGSTSVVDFKGTSGPFMGVGTSASGASLTEPNQQKAYEDWEFLWDPRIDELKSKTSIFGGGPASGSPPSGFPGATGTTGPTGPTGGLGSPNR